MPFFGVRPPPSLCALAVHIGRLLYRYIAFAVVQGGRFSRSELSCPISDVTGLLPERTHFASGALQHGLLLS